MNNLQSDHN